ncbi:hypothetical protein NLX83_31360 [Allokutzneria sp. A3M-2-11 16]|uniref:hypothetical protein n=1 Tax=Allokutzneria sp. A3M-2-11 16 TaxID=2962043 RepID=UPI0020B6E8A0|nr:hypothetical protein [Allokutzneria sp. A3M-2-11 16]MCP3803778.1 hypothetical protein [Allokutzneria sp. A3M-2-11 16]
MSVLMVAASPNNGDTTRAQLRARELREKGFSWAQIVDVLAFDIPSSPLRLYRLAHNRSAAHVVDEFNRLDPAATATLRVQRLYDYEMWPDGGRRPSVWVLPVLARMYCAAARDLVTDATYASYSAEDQARVDAADYGHLDQHRPRPAPLPPAPTESPERRLTDDLVLPTPAQPNGLDQLLVPTRDESFELFRAVTRTEPDPGRQETLFRLAQVFGGVSGLPVVRRLRPEERERLANATFSPHRPDATTIEIFKNVTGMCRHLDDSKGPEPVLKAVLRYRSVVGEMLGTVSRSGLERDLVQVYAELSQLAGWLLYDVGRYPAADRYFREGLAAAQEIKDIRTITFIHCCLAHMAIFREQIPKALDHVFAARGWAAQSGSALLATYTEQIAAWGYSTDGQEVATSRALNRMESLLPDRLADDDPEYLYFVDRGFTVGFQAGSWVRLNQSKRALQASESALELTAPDLVRNRGFRLIDRAKALVLQKEIPEAVRVLEEIAEIAAGHSSVRVGEWMFDVRRSLQPWAHSPDVKQFDERLVHLGLSPRNTTTRK